MSTKNKIPRLNWIRNDDDYFNITIKPKQKVKSVEL